jgi:hypothetical protein
MSNVGSNEKNSSDGIAIIPVTNTEYHPLLEGSGATGCGIDTKVELRKISEKCHFLIDQWHCIYSPR